MTPKARTEDGSAELPKAAVTSRKREPGRKPKVQVHAHRGGAGLAPENTMEAFSNAVELGVAFLELDVRTCATGELVVLHDETLQRVAGHSAPVQSLSLRELQSLDVGSHFDARFEGCRVPTLIEVLETLRGRVQFNIEIKEDGLRGDGTSERLGRLIHAMGLYAETIVSSFNVASLRRVRGLCNAPLGLLYPGEGVGRIRSAITRRPWAAQLLSVYALHPRHDLVDAEYVRRAHLRGLAVNAWTVDDADRMRELVEAKVTGLITDHPGRALAIVAELDPLVG